MFRTDLTRVSGGGATPHQCKASGRVPGSPSYLPMILVTNQFPSRDPEAWERGGRFEFRPSKVFWSDGVLQGRKGAMSCLTWTLPLLLIASFGRVSSFQSVPGA